jgi:hypothetical protein
MATAALNPATTTPGPAHTPDPLPDLPTNERSFRLAPRAPATARRGLTNLGIGLAILGVGAAVTMGTYESARSSGGGSFLICTGAFIFGGIQALAGIVQLAIAIVRGMVSPVGRLAHRPDGR